MDFKHPTAKKPLPYEDDLHSYVPTASNPPTSTRSNRAPIVAAPDPRYEKLQHSYVPTPSNPPTSTWSSRAPIVAAPDPREADQENDSKKFACPFYKLDPVTHFSCLTRQDLSQTNHVRQHLNRSHVASQQCPTCHITFEKTADWNRHVRGRGCEPPAAGTSYTNMTADQSDKISRLPRNYNAKERWYMMWDVLFPGMPRPPSPYVDDIRVECTRGPLIDFFKANGLSRLLEGARQAQSPGEEAILLAELIVTFMQNQINHHVPVGTLPAPPAAVAPALVMESSPPEPHDRLDNPPLDGDVVPMGLDPPNQSFDGDAVIVSLDSHNPGIGEDTTPFQITQNFQGTQASQSAPTFLPPPMMSGAQSAGWANTMASGNMNLGQVPNTTLASSQFAFPSYDYRETIFQDSWNERLAPVSSSSPGTLLSTEHMAAPAAAGVMDSAGDLFSPTAGFGENSFPPLPVDPYPQPAQGNGDMGYATVTGFASFDLHSGNSLAQTSNGGPFSIPDDPSWSEEADLSMEGFGLDGTHPARPPHGPS
ncbi:unnamed protein product [Parascedosporium putredinis]|uniref:C2H2-type domain-containing protein n=1 Tax=Parascedosporium putredinis TaxID=1442378 RepID=A0A9P1H8P8_9PEZI|nr:unnamed protein product [Parascedosporium putredinis]CAI8000049.1 unnamed protein product [Parascedosporium putredinis]